MYKIYHRDKKGAHRATAALFGTMIGAGIFALPHAVEQSGVFIGLFWMIVLAAVALLNHLLIGEIAVHTPGDHRLVGYIGIYLGKWQRNIQAVSSVLGLVGGSLAYLIIGGIFLQQIMSPIFSIDSVYWSAALFLFGAATVWRGANFLARVDFWLSLGLVLVFLLIIIKSFANLEPAHLMTVDFGNAFLPYGIVLFAYGGVSAVIEMKEIIGRKAAVMRQAIVVGTLAAAALTILFTVSTVGALGPATTSESIAGLAERFGGPIPLIGAVAGFLAVITSYIVFSLFLKEQFHFDFKWPHFWAWVVAVVVPFILFMAGIRSFGRVLELVGSVLVGVQGIFIGFAYLAVKRKYGKRVLRVPNGVVYFLITAFAAGALYELIFRVLS